MTHGVDSTAFFTAPAGGCGAASAMTMAKMIKITPTQERGERA